jgi:hypothetical protein
MKNGDAIVTFDDVFCVRETEKALGCVVIGRTRLFWVPRSQLRDGNQVTRSGDSGRLVVTQWWADTSTVALNFPAEDEG